MSNGGDFGERELDPEERRAAETNLDDPTAGDDEPWTPPERQPRAGEFLDSTDDETLDVRIRQEEPEADSAYGDPDDADTRAPERVGGDDPDAIDPEDDFLGDEVPLDDVDDVPASLGDEDGPEVSAMRVTE